jgi:hypothetical protein
MNADQDSSALIRGEASLTADDAIRGCCSCFSLLHLSLGNAPAVTGGGANLPGVARLEAVFVGARFQRAHYNSGTLKTCRHIDFESAA